MTEVPNKTRKRNKPEMLGKLMSNYLFAASPVMARVPSKLLSLSPFSLRNKNLFYGKRFNIFGSVDAIWCQFMFLYYSTTTNHS
jgi:hypothetical protein